MTHDEELNEEKNMTDTNERECAYCFQPKSGPGLHDCRQAQDAKGHIDATIASIERIAIGQEGVTKPPGHQMKLNQILTEGKS
jgi:hypothetical protein